MNQYNFDNFSPFEFELLVRDLLQKKLHVFLESFTSGRDEGIDLRYSKASRKKDLLIVQCKKYTTFSSLHSNLKKERYKVDSIKPKRYILCTSVGLTPHQKTILFELFKPYIHNTADILGKEDINNLITQFPEIEKRHFKLWLSSSTILDRIIHSKTVNQSTFEKEIIINQTKVYVRNPSFHEALQKLKTRHCLIISGMPGIGKTILARMLVYYLLASGFEEFVFLTDSINDGYELYKEGKKQIFLFDDFLGRNFINNQLMRNEDEKILKFMDKITKDNDKVLIMTTREYILHQAVQRYERFNSQHINLSKFIIDLSSYTKIIKAKILYNHLYFSGIPAPYILDIINEKKYKQIIEHKNYNPRIISVLVNDREVWAAIEPTQFFNTLKSYFDNPTRIWESVFTSQITDLSRTVLYTLLISGTPL